MIHKTPDCQLKKLSKLSSREIILMKKKATTIDWIAMVMRKLRNTQKISPS